VTYLLQARWLLGGELWGSVTALQDHLGVPYTYVVGERWLGHYPPGWPLLLAIGLAVGAPWLVAPVLGGLFVILLYLAGRELDGPVTGLLSASLCVVSPMARLIFGCMLSHAAAATLILASLWLLLISRRLKTWPTAALSGVGLGLAFGIRPLWAAATGVPFAALVLLDLVARRDHDARPRALAWFVGGTAASLPTLIANHFITGSALAFPYSLAKGSMYFAANLPFGIRNADVLLYSAGNVLHGWGWPRFHGPFWIALAFSFALVPFLLRRIKATDVLLAVMVGTLMVALLGSRGHGLHGFGPRYLFEIFAPLYLLTARGFVELARKRFDEPEEERPLLRSASTLLFVILCGTAALALPHRLGLYRGYNDIDGSLASAVTEAGLERALILLPPGDWRGWAMAAGMFEPDPDASLLFIQAEPDDPLIANIAGDRPIYAWRDRRLVKSVN
jgi:4-amino-4-deoxy-L-arabinose transferase-like glycosyltransferase